MRANWRSAPGGPEDLSVRVAGTRTVRGSLWVNIELTPKPHVRAFKKAHGVASATWRRSISYY